MKHCIVLAAILQSLCTRVHSSPTQFKVTPRGNAVWRVQTALPDGKYEEKGAVQSLAEFMGEDEPGRASAPDGSRVEQTADGELRVYSASGRLVLELSRISGKTLSGRLLSQEAIYGGGERFDRLNKRGQKLDLFTSDGWNNSGTTYLAVPFFTTTRGGGFFFNSYSRMAIDFGATSPETWTASTEDDALDLYIFATDRIADSVERYCKLSGMPGRPDAWNFGPVICRYSPDLTVLKGKTSGVKNGTRYLGYGIVDMMQQHLALGVTPTAIIAEGWGTDLFATRKAKYVIAERTADGALKWLDEKKTDIATRTVEVSGEESARMKQQATKDAAEYLASRGTRLMCWMFTGSPLSTSAPGFKEEYLVHADVYTNGAIAVANTQNIFRVPSSGNPDASSATRGDRYIDITNPEAWQWYINTVWAKMTECGFAGAKIDFCELMPDDGRTYGALSLKYRWKNPEVFRRAAVHHAYPTFFISKLTREMKVRSGKRGFMVLARGGGIGSQRNPYVWAGDQVRTFPKLRDQLLAVLNSGISGVPFITYDMAGYQYAALTSEPAGTVDGVPVFLRRSRQTSLEEEARIFRAACTFTAFTPCIQTHGFVRNVWELGEKTKETWRKFAGDLSIRDELRERLVRDAVAKGAPVSRPLVWRWQNDPNVFDICDEFLYGDDLLVAPIIDGSSSRTIYLPEGRWREVASGTLHVADKRGKRLRIEVPDGEIALFRLE